MFGLHFKTLFPAIIFALCILEMSFGLYIRFHVVWWFYFYFVWSLINYSGKRKADGNSKKISTYSIVLYLLSCLIYIIHHFLGKEFYKISTNETFNILWWTMFGALLVYQIKQGHIYNQLFNLYIRNIVFFGCFISSSLGIFKYFNLLSGNSLDSYYYLDRLLTGSSLNADYNVYALGLSIGGLLSIGFYNNFKKRSSKILYSGVISAIILAILLSGSRRGILMSGFTLFCLLYSNRIMAARRQITLFSIIFVPIIVLFLINNNWDIITQYIESTDLLHQSITRVLTLKDELQNENERTTRFYWGFNYFLERNGTEQFFGSGFEYLKLMGYTFLGEFEDNPHNYLLSSLLYGGSIGFVLMILLSINLISSSFHFHRFWYPVVLIVLLFGLTSSNSLFSLRIFPSLLLLMSLHKSKFINNKLNSILPQVHHTE